jgi:hypothetical protein
MHLWQMNVMGGVLLDDDTELKVVTGVDTAGSASQPASWQRTGRRRLFTGRFTSGAT